MNLPRVTGSKWQKWDVNPEVEGETRGGRGGRQEKGRQEERKKDKEKEEGPKFCVSDFMVLEEIYYLGNQLPTKSPLWWALSGKQRYLRTTLPLENLVTYENIKNKVVGYRNLTCDIFSH